MGLFLNASSYFQELQNSICSALEEADGLAKFNKDSWEKEKKNSYDAGGGLTRVIQNGRVFEKGGVNFSAVEGVIPAKFAKQLVGIEEDQKFSATGISLVIHPLSPMVPTTHANYRYLEVGNKAWFGGGADLTPYYLFEDDAIHFHQTLKNACDLHDQNFYPKFKKECDVYFHLTHRNEARGIGGIFFDYVGRDSAIDYDKTFTWVKSLGDVWCDGYVPIVKKRLMENYSDEQRQWQLIRRGRYVEFNLVYDRGTKFGLETGGRTESILMSLPNIVRWEYDYQPQTDSPEAKLIDVLKNPVDWLA